MNTKIVWAIAALILVGGGVAYVSLRNVAEKNAPAATSPIPLAPQEAGSGPEAAPGGESPDFSMLQGTVTGINPEKLEITVMKDSIEKIARVSPSTKIEKVISQKDVSGIEEKQALEEVNMDSLRKGDAVTVGYQSEKDNALSGVSRITFVVEGNIDEYFKQRVELQKTNPDGYIKGEVVSINITGKVLEYKPYRIDEISTTTVSMSLPENMPVYIVDKNIRVSIIHARTVASLEDVKPGQTIFLKVEKKSILTGGKIIPQALIISGE